MKKLYYGFKLTICKIIALIPRNKQVAIFGAWFGQKFADNSKYLYLYCNNNSSFKHIIWITKNKDVYKYINSLGYRCYMNNSLKGMYFQIIAKYIFICTGIDDVFSPLISGAIIVNLWHGVPLKKICYDDEINFKNIDPSIQKINSFITKREYSVCTSKVFESIYKSAFKKSKEYILNLGQPRNDVFFDNDLEIDNSFINELDSSKRIILYMPTHRNEGKSRFPLTDVIDFDDINKLCEINNCILLIKLHYYHANEIKSNPNHKNIVNITNTHIDSQLLLKYSDVLITDYSSCYIDYLLLKKPIIFYPFDLESYIQHDRDLYFDFFSVTNQTLVYSYQELKNNLITIFTENTISQKQAELTDFFYDEDNRRNVSQKIIKFIKELN